MRMQENLLSPRGYPPGPGSSGHPGAERGTHGRQGPHRTAAGHQPEPYAQRATWFIDRTLEGQYAAALQVGSDRFRRDIGEKGLRTFRDSMAKYGKGRFVPTTAGAEEGYFVVAGLLEFPGGRKMAVHVIFKGDKVEHLYQRWAVS